MPGPEGPAHRGWLGVVTGIRLIQISTGGVLVLTTWLVYVVVGVRKYDVFHELV